MLRNALLWASTNPFMAERLPRYGFVKKATRRFMPGEELDDALREAERLRGDGIDTTVTRLGENVASAAEADAVVDHYREVLETIATRGLPTEISVKPTQLGLDQDVDGARDRLLTLVREAGTSLVWIDMESSAYVDRTLELFRAAREDHENVGLCLQAYLHRTADDLDTLMPLHPAIRLVKGAYREPPDVAMESKGAVDANFRRLTATLLRARKRGEAGRPVIASHDPQMVGEANRMAHELELPKDAYEFAMLYGIQTEEQRRLVRGGYSMRVLVSYGNAWFPWYMRRLAERPANVWFVLKQMVG